MADYTVTTDFKAKDNISPQLRSMESQTKHFSTSMKASLGSIFKGSFLGTLTGNIVSSGLSRIRMGITNVVTEFAELDNTLNEAAVKFGGIDYGSDKFKELGAVAREVGRTTKFTSQDAAGGLMDLAGAGFKAEDSMKLLPSVANFAAAAKMNLSEGAEVAGKSLRAFAMASDDAAVQSANLIKISDMLAKTDAATGATMYGLAETVAWAASRFTAAGQSINTFGAIAGGLANVKIEGSLAGTVMKQMVAQLTDLDAKGTAALRSMGLSFKKDIIDNKGNLLNVIDILDKMEEPLERMGTAKRSKVIQDLFGERAAGGAIALINGGIASVKKLEIELQNAAGTSKLMGDQLNKSLTFRIMELQNAFQEKGFQIFENVLTDGRGGIEGMIDAVNKFDVRPIADGMRDLGKGIKFLIDNRAGLWSVAKAFIAIKLALGAMDFLRWSKEMKLVAASMRGTGMFASLGSIIRPGMAPGVNAAMAGTAGAATTAATAATAATTGAVTAGSVAVKSTGAVSFMGGANVILSGLAAGVVGYQIGEVISQYLERETSKTFDRIEKGSDIQLKLREAAFGKTTPEQKLQIIKEAEAHKQESMPNQFNKIWHSLLGAVTGEKSTWELWREQNKGINEKIDLVRMAFDAQSAQLKNIENYYNPNKEFQGNIPDSKNVFSGMPSWKTNIPEYQERQAGITQMANEIAGKVHKQDLDLFRKTFGEFAPLDVNIKIENDGDGKVTATTKTKGPRAPRVDVSRAGANQ